MWHISSPSSEKLCSDGVKGQGAEGASQPLHLEFFPPSSSFSPPSSLLLLLPLPSLFLLLSRVHSSLPPFLSRHAGFKLMILLSQLLSLCVPPCPARNRTLEEQASEEKSLWCLTAHHSPPWKRLREPHAFCRAPEGYIQHP